MTRFFIDQKYSEFKLLAIRGSDRVYAFKYKGCLFVVEDIPMNYPSVSVWKEPRSNGKTLKKQLESIGFDIEIDHTENS